MKIGIVGGGWAGLAAAVYATRAGHQVTLFEAARTLGGRARAIAAALPDGRAITLDNGQHILIGAYTESLHLMHLVGIDLTADLLRLPLTLRFPDNQGIKLPDSFFLPAPLDALAGITLARGWSPSARWGLLRLAFRWWREDFRCDPAWTVAQLCQPLAPQVMRDLIEPLCVSALNTPTTQASALVFLRVLQDALFSVRGGSHLLLPRTDLSALFPNTAANWLQRNGATVKTHARVAQLSAQGSSWHLAVDGGGEIFDAVVLAASATESARLLTQHAPQADAFVETLKGTLGASGTSDTSGASAAEQMRHWIASAQDLKYEAIATIYAWGKDARLQAPMLALRSTPDAPAQFVFDRGQIKKTNDPNQFQDTATGLLAFVVSASTQPREVLQAQVLQQARTQLGLSLQAVQTVVEKRATFACTPGLQRPACVIASGRNLWACGDFVQSPYPATLEGAIRSAQQLVALLP